ncbi:MAG: sodium/sugar symporter [Bacteroidota bacterium]
MNFSTIDFIIFGSYCALILGVGLFVSRGKKGQEKNAEDYFLAGKTLPWWAIGSSLIAANISAEQFIGMSGAGFASGLAIASYEWMGGITLLLVGKYFLPIFIKKNIYTIPEFVEKRYSKELKSILAIFWIALFIFVNLASVLYLGSLALEGIIGIPMSYGIVGLALFAAAYSLYGGLSAVAWTDVIQVFFLVLGGLFTTYLALDILSEGTGWVGGFSKLMESAPDKFQMILDKSNPEYINLPGIWVLIGGMWVANLYYWGFNQYIIQRTLAAKSLGEAQNGIAMAAFLKLLIPFIVVIPGIAAYAIVNDAELMSQLGEQAILRVPTKSDEAYPWLLQLLPTGMKGIAVAALTAAIVSSLASMLNSTSTIFTLDLYKTYIKPTADDKSIVRVGRISAAVALFIACIVAPVLGGIDQAIQYIQEYSGIVSPGILAVFLLGLFYKKTSNSGAIAGAIASIPIALILKLFTPLPWLHQMGITAILTMIIIIITSHLREGGKDDPKSISLSPKLFSTSPTFNLLAFAVTIICAVFYALYW